jgi:hypothetical protein
MHAGEYSFICLLLSIHPGEYIFLLLLFSINSASFVCYFLYTQGNRASLVCFSKNIKKMKLYYPGSIDDKNKWSCIPLGA